MICLRVACLAVLSLIATGTAEGRLFPARKHEQRVVRQLENLLHSEELLSLVARHPSLADIGRQVFSSPIDSDRDGHADEQTELLNAAALPGEAEAEAGADQAESDAPNDIPTLYQEMVDTFGTKGPSIAAVYDGRYCHHLTIPLLQQAVAGAEKVLQATSGETTPRGKLLNSAIQLVNGDKNFDHLDKVCVMGILYTVTVKKP